MKMIKRLGRCSACAMALAALGATAQETGKTAGDGKASAPVKAVQLDAVVVTARYREEVLQRIPVSVTALDAGELQSRGAEDLGALGAAVPNLTIYAARPFNNALTAYIRGIGQSETVWGVDPGVGVYVDDVYLARPQAALLDVLDVERIEVLRGPQGTLYGKNTIGGAIRYITRAADDEFSGNLGVTVGDYDRRDFKGVVNLPIGERLRTRVAFASLDRDGFGKNLVTGDEVSAQHAGVARVSVEWTPHDDVEVRLAYDRYRDRSGPRGARRRAVNPNDPLRTPPDNGNYDVRSGMPSLDEMDSEGASATVDWTLNERWRLKSITAYRAGDSLGNVDFDLLPLPISDLNRRLFERQASQEFQLLASSGRAHAIAGLYLFDGEAGGTVRQTIQGRMFNVSRGVVKTGSAAIYGDLTWDFTDKLSLEGGLRYTSEKKTGTVLNRGYTDATFTVPRGAALADFTDSKTFSSLSPRVNVSYKLTEAAMLYAQASRGFKSGGYNIRANTRFVPGSGLPFKDETATSYELGAKTQWLDGKITANAAAFHNDYRDIQLSVFTSYDSNGDGINDALFGDFKNAGAGTINGAEFELSALTGRHLRWLGHVGYLDTHYDGFISNGVDIADSQHFANAPRWTGGLSAIADIPLGPAGSLQARVDGNYQSKVYPTTELNQASAETLAQEGYTLWNASLTYRSPDGKWQAALQGQNLGDKAYRTTGYDFPVYGIRTGYYGPPGTVSLSLTYLF
ncbi:MAG: TonB-dependent receptor [Pseudoxanthomonas sp.]